MPSYFAINPSFIQLLLPFQKMKLFFPSLLVLTIGLILGASPLASAHIGYSGRNLGTFDGSGFASINNQSTYLFGWADGTDADFADSHDVRAFRFTLLSSGWVTLTLQANVGAEAFLPAFSLYSGVTNAVGGSPTDGTGTDAAATNAYLATLGGTYEGAFDALHDWKVYNAAGAESAFTYIGNAADGTSANYGSAAGINGDGLANGYVTATYYLTAGNYSMFVGGANYAAQDDALTNANTYGFTTSIQVVPEPATSLLLLTGAGAAWMFKRRRSRHS